jgi:hypothetical protein
MVHDPHRKSLLHGATYIVPRAGIEPTPRTDIGYRPVTQTHQSRREPLGHHVLLTFGFQPFIASFVFKMEDESGMLEEISHECRCLI